MDDKTRRDLDNMLTSLRADNTMFVTMMGMPAAPVVGGIPPVPIMIDPALQPYLQALRTHAENFDVLCTVVQKLLSDGK